MNVKALRITSFDDSFPVRAAISPFGKWLAVIYSDSRLKLFLVSEKDGQVNLMADKNWFSGVNDVAFSADPGSVKVTEMALATNEGITRVNLTSRESLKPVTSAGARSISYSGAFAIVGLENGSFQIWRLDSEPRLVQETATGFASAITTSRANRSGDVYLIDEGGRSLVWLEDGVSGILSNKDTGAPFFPFQAEVLALHPTEPVVAFSSGATKAFEDSIKSTLGLKKPHQAGDTSEDFGGGRVCLVGGDQVWFLDSRRVYAQFLKFTASGGLLIGSNTGFETWGPKAFSEPNSIELEFKAFWTPSSVGAERLLALLPVGDSAYVAVV